jgi:peptide/nickel transport system substrate-binding protein
MVKGNNVMFMAVNYLSTAHKVLASLKVREAMFYAVNKKDINNAVCEGYGSETDQYFPTEYVTATPVSGFKTYPFNPGLSKKLLAEAGYPNGVDVGTILIYGTATSFNARMGEVLQANFAEVGIKAQLYVAEMAIITPRIYKLDYDICVWNGIGNFDFDTIGTRVSSKSQGLYVIKYKDGPFNWQRIEKLLDLGASTSDVTKRTAYYTELWSIVMDSATMLPCIHRPVGIVWSKSLDIGQPVPTFYKIRTTQHEVQESLHPRSAGIRGSYVWALSRESEDVSICH